MSNEPRPFTFGIISDEITRDLAKALELARGWGLHHFELREGREGRFPAFTSTEVRLVEDALRAGDRITAVSPGVFKGSIEDTAQVRREVEDVVPRAIEGAVRFESPVLIVFGFTRTPGEPEKNRLKVLQAFEQVAEQATAAGLTVAVENEPGFWVDRPDETVALLEEIGHPALRLNWDPANLHWGGLRPTYEAFCTLQPYIANVHMKDFYPDDPSAPWRPIGQGVTPWSEILPWIVRETALGHVTLETHIEPGIERSQETLEAARAILENLDVAHD